MAESIGSEVFNLKRSAVCLPQTQPLRKMQGQPHGQFHALRMCVIISVFQKYWVILQLTSTLLGRKRSATMCNASYRSRSQRPYIEGRNCDRRRAFSRYVSMSYYVAHSHIHTATHQDNIQYAYRPFRRETCVSRRMPWKTFAGFVSKCETICAILYL